MVVNFWVNGMINVINVVFVVQNCSNYVLLADGGWYSLESMSFQIIYQAWMV